MKFLITGLPGSTPIPRDQGAEPLLDEILAYPRYPFFTWKVKPLLNFEGAYQAYSGIYER
jgi:hypothetical protein